MKRYWQRPQRVSTSTGRFAGTIRIRGPRTEGSVYRVKTDGAHIGVFTLRQSHYGLRQSGNAGLYCFLVVVINLSSG
jgi:hypothetical protein